MLLQNAGDRLIMFAISHNCLIRANLSIEKRNCLARDTSENSQSKKGVDQTGRMVHKRKTMKIGEN